MTTEPHTPSPNLSAGQQRRQASILLLRLQWLLILLLIMALFWLYISQQRFQNHVNERLQNNEQVTTRLNEMDDRLFAISQQSVPEPRVAASNQAQNQLDLLRIQIQAVDKLLADNDDKAAIDLLRGLQWQLSQRSNEIAPALTIVIKKSLSTDIERLQAQSSQPSPWQLQSIAIQNIQEFLHNHERIDSHERENSRERTGSDHKKETASKTSKTVITNVSKTQNIAALTRRQLTIHEVIMTLNLALQSSNMHEKSQLVDYLNQARSQLQTLNTTSKNTKKAVPAEPAKSVQDTEVSPDSTRLSTIETPSSVSEAIIELDKLIANAPTATPLLTTQILEQPKK